MGIKSSGVTLSLRLVNNGCGFILLIGYRSKLGGVQRRRVVPSPGRLVRGARVFASSSLGKRGQGCLPVINRYGFHIPSGVSNSGEVALSPDVLLRHARTHIRFVFAAISSKKGCLSPLLPLSGIAGLSLGGRIDNCSILPSTKRCATANKNGPSVEKMSCIKSPLLLPRETDFRRNTGRKTKRSTFIAGYGRELLPCANVAPGCVCMTPKICKRKGRKTVTLILSISCQVKAPSGMCEVRLCGPSLSRDSGSCCGVHHGAVCHIFTALGKPKGVRCSVIISR